jgi:hypothetical protein
MSCEFGSEPKDDSPTYFRYLEVDIGNALPNIAGLVWSWVLGLPSGWLSTADFCSTEPTGDLPTGTDWVLLAFPPLALIAGSYGRFANQVRAWKFAELCQCSAGDVSCAERYPDSYTGWSSIGPLGGAVELGMRFTVSQPDLYFYGFRVWHAQAITTSIGYNLWDNSTGLEVVGFTTGGNTNGYHRFEIPTPFPLVNGRTYTVSYHLPTGYQYFQQAVTTPPTNALVVYGTGYHGSSGSYPNTSSDGDHSIDPIVCLEGATPIDPPPDAPPPDGFPDPVLGPPECNDSYMCSTLYKLDGKIDLLSAMVLDALQRITPYRVAPGAIFTGLTGSGTISAPGILGLHVTLTAVPSTWGSTTAVPVRWIPAVGDVLFDTPDGLTCQEFIHYDEQLILNVPPMTTEVAYSFRPGVTATLQLLNPWT